MFPEPGGLAVVGVLLESNSSSPNPALAAALSYVPPTPASEQQCPQAVDPQQLLPPPDSRGQRHWLHYSGSLTTPPCSEQVEWFVMKSKLGVSRQQVMKGERRAAWGVSAQW
jgi:carbonic anhydrase